MTYLFQMCNSLGPFTLLKLTWDFKLLPCIPFRQDCWLGRHLQVRDWLHYIGLSLFQELFKFLSIIVIQVLSFLFPFLFCFLDKNSKASVHLSDFCCDHLLFKKIYVSPQIDSFSSREIYKCSNCKTVLTSIILDINTGQTDTYHCLLKEQRQNLNLGQWSTISYWWLMCMPVIRQENSAVHLLNAYLSVKPLKPHTVSSFSLHNRGHEDLRNEWNPTMQVLPKNHIILFRKRVFFKICKILYCSFKTRGYLRSAWCS